ncbi:hypothetical protein FKM82_022139 [Ascaphus truei]
MEIGGVIWVSKGVHIAASSCSGLQHGIGGEWSPTLLTVASSCLDEATPVSDGEAVIALPGWAWLMQAKWLMVVVGTCYQLVWVHLTSLGGKDQGRGDFEVSLLEVYREAVAVAS